jgi:hypothetical protein
MASVIITIEDTPDGKVKIVCVPSFEQIIKQDVSGESFTAAQGYALMMLNKAREESKNNNPLRLVIPRVTGY